MRNGIRVKKSKVTVIETKLTKRIAEILKTEGFIDEIRTPQKASPKESNRMTAGVRLPLKTSFMNAGSKKLNNGVPTFEIFLKYKDRLGKPESVVTDVKCVSRPGVRIYANANKIPQVLGGLGVTILSTSSGILTDAQARNLKVGGEIICTIW